MGVGRENLNQTILPLSLDFGRPGLNLGALSRWGGAGENQLARGFHHTQPAAGELARASRKDLTVAVGLGKTRLPRPHGEIRVKANGGDIDARRASYFQDRCAGGRR